MSSETHRLQQRTRLMVDARTYLSPTDTQTLTGHTRHTLRLRVDEGSLVAHRVGTRTFSYRTDSVITYCQRRHPEFTLFDRLDSAEGELITEPELTAELDHAPAGTWWTLARRDHCPPDWPTWQAWYQGETERAEQVLAEQQSRWEQENARLRARGVLRRTLWVPAQPLSGYGRYCLARYRHVVAAGGQVRVLPAWKCTHLEHRRSLPDLEVLPGVVYARRHTHLGSRTGALRIQDPGLSGALHEFLTWASDRQALSLIGFTRWRHPLQGAA
ncbi:DUF6879 family protein [Nocardiopsis sp. NPDC006832]|uniref:DUF6879 family protein n=1 Tax=Nocardiopsis sp. NPDC006832 TaxID=3157188 RepID=UPI0033D3AB13